MKTNPSLSIGVRVELADGRRGLVRYLGPTAQQPGIWAGIELDEPLGKNDGATGGQRYFSCPPNHGIFIHPSKVVIADTGSSLASIIAATPVRKAVHFPNPSKPHVNNTATNGKPLPVVSVSADLKATSKSDPYSRSSGAEKYKDLHDAVIALKSYVKDLEEAKRHSEQFFTNQLKELQELYQRRLSPEAKRTEVLAGHTSAELTSSNLEAAESNLREKYMEWIFSLRRSDSQRIKDDNKAAFIQMYKDLSGTSARLLDELSASIQDVSGCVRRVSGARVVVRK